MHCGFDSMVILWYCTVQWPWLQDVIRNWRARSRDGSCWCILQPWASRHKHQGVV